MGSCLLFLTQDTLYETTKETFKILECVKCRLIRLDPLPSPEELRQYYPSGFWLEHTALGHGLQGFLARVAMRDHIHFVERGLRESGEQGLIVDVGCGGGLFLHMMAQRGHKKIAGLHFGLDTAAVAANEAGVPSVCATLSRPPFRAGTCAAITLFHVLEHLYDPVSYLEAAHEMLAPDGRLYLQVPNAGCWQFLLLAKFWSGVDAPRHLVHFRPRDLELLLYDCGFEILRHKYFSLRDNPRAWAASIAPHWDPSVRRLRRLEEAPRQAALRDAGFILLTAAALPIAVIESACRAGSTVIIEARRKS